MEGDGEGDFYDENANEMYDEVTGVTVNSANFRSLLSLLATSVQCSATLDMSTISCCVDYLMRTVSASWHGQSSAQCTSSTSHGTTLRACWSLGKLGATDSSSLLCPRIGIPHSKH